jgi:DNA replication protein DnaC
MINPSIHKLLEELGLHGVLRALDTQYSSNEFDDLSYEEKLEHLFITQVEEDRNRQMTRRVKQARLRFPNACTENIEFGGERSGHKKLILSLLTGSWVMKHLNVIISGASGTGKTYLANAIANALLASGYKVLYYRLDDFFKEAYKKQTLDQYSNFRRALLKIDLLILDDFGACELTAEQVEILYCILEDRYTECSTLITSQIPVQEWHAFIGSDNVADAILDRMVHNAHKLPLHSKKSMREKFGKIALEEDLKESKGE